MQQVKAVMPDAPNPTGYFPYQGHDIYSASEIYQRCITEILADEPQVAVNPDDVFVGGVDEMSPQTAV